MKRILLVIMLFLDMNTILAIENIEINNESLVPKFDINTKVYNYFTDKDKIRINVEHTNDEIVYGSGIHNIIEGKNTFVITSNNNEEYTIHVFKNYKKSVESYLIDLSIEGHDINFDKNIHEYYVNIDDEEYLDIDYELSNYNVLFSISGNGNFINNDNIITITVNDEEYIIHALKTTNVSFIQSKPIIKEMSKQKKEIVALIIITISCILVFIFFYSLFIFN